MHVWKVRNDLLIRGMFDKRPDKLDELQELGVTSVICMLRKTDPDLENLDWLTYRNFPTPDTNRDGIDAIDPKATQSLNAAAFHAVREISEGKKVLIHCISAKDRTPTAAAIALTILEGISGSAALMRVRSIKPTTFTNKSFIKYLNSILPLEVWR